MMISKLNNTKTRPARRQRIILLVKQQGTSARWGQETAQI
jgi:hypothetical protein